MYLRSRAFQNKIPVNIWNEKHRIREIPTILEYVLYHKRETIEWFFAWLNIGFRNIASRYEKLNFVFKGLLDIACFMLCWERYERSFEMSENIGRSYFTAK